MELPRAFTNLLLLIGVALMILVFGKNCSYKNDLVMMSAVGLGVILVISAVLLWV